MIDNAVDEMKAVLLSLREPNDPMSHQEHQCFCRASGLLRIEVICAPQEDLVELREQVLSADLLFFGGSGAFSVLDSHPWVRRFLEFLPLVPERGIPAWASCFAFQGLALAMGGEVVRDDARQQLGACPVELTEEGRIDPLFKSQPDRFYAQFGHHDHVIRVPSGVTVLTTGNGFPQSFVVDNSRFWGAQFHPELEKESTLERWNHYRKNYEGDRGDEIDRTLREAPETPGVKQLLRNLVELARTRRASSSSEGF